MMELQLLGVLQDLGTPYASLYVNKEKVLFIGLKVESMDSCVFKSLLINVSFHDIDNYFNGEIGLRQIANNSTKRYMWSRKKGTSGTLLNLCQNELMDNIDEDDMYDAFFCTQEALIKYHLEQLKIS